MSKAETPAPTCNTAVGSNYPSWAPRPGEWKPGMKWAAMDSDGAVFQYQYRPKAIHKRWSAGSGKSFAYAMCKPLEEWTQAFVRRPEVS